MRDRPCQRFPARNGCAGAPAACVMSTRASAQSLPTTTATDADAAAARLHRTTKRCAAFRGFYGVHCNYTMGRTGDGGGGRGPVGGHRCRTPTITSSSSSFSFSFFLFPPYTLCFHVVCPTAVSARTRRAQRVTDPSP